MIYAPRHVPTGRTVYFFLLFSIHVLAFLLIICCKIFAVTCACYYCAGDKMEKNEMGGACSAYGRGKGRVQVLGGEA